VHLIAVPLLFDEEWQRRNKNKQAVDFCCWKCNFPGLRVQIVPSVTIILVASVYCYINCVLSVNYFRSCLAYDTARATGTIVHSVPGRSLAQEVNFRPLTAESWDRTQVFPCEICGRQSVTGTGFSPYYFPFSCPYYSISAPYSPIYHLGNGKKGPVRCPVPQRHGLTASQH
jgi:hypothetical protein